MTFFRQLSNLRFSRNLAMKHESMSRRNVSQGICDKFSFKGQRDQVHLLMTCLSAHVKTTCLLSVARAPAGNGISDVCHCVHWRPMITWLNTFRLLTLKAPLLLLLIGAGAIYSGGAHAPLLLRVKEGKMGHRG